VELDNGKMHMYSTELTKQSDENSFRVPRSF